MIRTPFHLPHGITLTADPVWVGEVQPNPIPLPVGGRKFILQIGTAAGIITEAWSEPDFLNSLRDNLLDPPEMDDE